jgi:hypothetical protein
VSARLLLTLDAERLDRVAIEVLVAPFFASDRPLRGPAARADWRLCGWLSEEIRQGRLHGERNEAALLLTGGRLRARWLLALGLGPRAGFGERMLREAACDGVRRLLALRTESAAFALPSEDLSGVAAEAGARAFFAGVADALRQRPRALGLRLLVEPAEARRVGPVLAASCHAGAAPFEARFVPLEPRGIRGGSIASNGGVRPPANAPANLPRAWFDDPRSSP